LLSSVSIQYLVVDKYPDKTGGTMAGYWERDERIDPDSPLKILEMKIHFLMQQLIGAGIVSSRGGNQIDVPDDIDQDGNEVLGGVPVNQ
jgi:hypothetical protein